MAGPGRGRVRPGHRHCEASDYRSGPDESAMGNLLTDAMREAYQGDVAFHVGVRGELAQGELTYRDAYT